MKRTLAVLLAVLIIFGCAALTACNKTGLVNDRDDAQIISADEIADTMTSKDGKYEIAMVTNVGRLKDKSFNQGTWDGVKTFAYQNGKSYKYYQPRNGNKASDDDRYNAFIEAISGGAKIIVATGYEQEKALKRAAAENPDTKFVFVDGYVLTDGNGKTLSNVAAVSFMEEQCGYLAGYAADVFSFEDWALEGRPERTYPPLLSPELNTLFTPHLGSAVDRVRSAIEMTAARNIVDVLEGRVPANPVNRVGGR